MNHHHTQKQQHRKNGNDGEIFAGQRLTRRQDSEEDAEDAKLNEPEWLYTLVVEELKEK